MLRTRNSNGLGASCHEARRAAEAGVLREPPVRIMFAGAELPMATRTTAPSPAFEFSIPVHDLDAGGRDFDLPVRAAWLRGVLEGTDVQASTKDGELHLRLSKSGSDVVLRGSISAEMTVPCSRCLEPTPVAVEASLSLLAVPGPSPRSARGPKGRPKAHRDEADDEEILESGEADVIPYDGDNVVLDDLVRDELLLGIPMIPLCSEACPGISPKLDDRAEAPDAQGVDPRLRPLLALKKKT